MLYGYGFTAVLELGLLIYCVLNVITTPESEVRNLPKMLWLVLVIFLPIVGGIAWLVAGRPQGPSRSLPYKGNLGSQPPGRPQRPTRAATSPDDDETFLADLRRRAEEQRRRAREQEDPPPA